MSDSVQETQSTESCDGQDCITWSFPLPSPPCLHGNHNFLLTVFPALSLTSSLHHLRRPITLTWKAALRSRALRVYWGWCRCNTRPGLTWCSSLTCLRRPASGLFTSVRRTNFGQEFSLRR